MLKTPLNRACPYIFHGIYDPDQTYAKGDVVLHDRGLFQSLKPNARGILPTNTHYWKVIALASVEKIKFPNSSTIGATIVIKKNDKKFWQFWKN